MCFLAWLRLTLRTSCRFSCTWVWLQVVRAQHQLCVSQRLASVKRFPALWTGRVFPALGFGPCFPALWLYVSHARHLLHFSHACHWFHVSRGYHWLHIVSWRLSSVACFPALWLCSPRVTPVTFFTCLSLVSCFKHLSLDAHFSVLGPGCIFLPIFSAFFGGGSKVMTRFFTCFYNQEAQEGIRACHNSFGEQPTDPEEIRKRAMGDPEIQVQSH